MAEAQENAIKQAKIKRRNCKGALTRQGKVVCHKLSANRPAEEIRKELKKYELAFEDLLSKHEEYLMLLDDDEQFEHEEAWMEDCQEIYLKLSTDTEDFLKEQLVLSQSAQEKGIAETSVTVSAPEGTTENSVSQDEIHTENTANQKGKTAISPSSYQSSQEHVAEVQNSIADNVQGTDNVITNGITEQNTPPVNANGNNTQSAFRMEKPNMPKFSGDVREFAIFKADFKHVVEARYSKHDSITILRARLNGKPLELIKGIGQDYDAAWEHLESIYGDPRFVADTITRDIARFKPLRDGEDARFCDLVHLVRRSFNTLSEVGRQNDMDNNHMLAIIEQKMCSDDRKVWSRFLETTKCHATLEALMSWMTSEMKSRMRATAPLRSSKPLNVNQISAFEEKGTANHKCWLCKVSTHWTDQCQKFTSMSPSDRLKAVKENHGCFSCLKRAGRDHKVSNCSRRRQCSESVNGSQCKYFHHPLLHGANVTNSAPGGGTPIHYLYGYVPPNGVVILKLLI